VKIHLGMMVKDRAASVERALQSAARFVDGYTILDTGSTDGTREIVSKYGKVRDVPWTGDYGEMRTKVMDACREDGADWYLMLDSDEEIIDGGDFAAALVAAQERDLDAVMVNCVPVMTTGRQPSEPNFRLIRTDRGMRWHYAYDEQLVGWRPDRIGFSTFTIEQDYCRSFDAAHAARHGYLGPMRNRSEYGSPDWCHATYFLMRSFQSIGDFKTAEQYAVEIYMAKPTAIGFASAWTTAARCAMIRGDTAAAWRRICEGTCNHPGYADLWHLAAILACGKMDETSAAPGPYFATAQIAETVRQALPGVLRGLGCHVEEAAA